ETGVIQDMEAIGKICAEKETLLFSDATQAAGKIEINPRQAGVYLMAFSAHKMYGPKGVGALYVSRRDPRVKIIAQIDGGGHERGMRSGTLNVPGIAGFGKAAQIAKMEMQQDAARLLALRNLLEENILENVESVFVNGNREKRLAHVSNLAFKFVESESLMMSFNRNLAVASGSACTSASLEPSHVLLAMGLSDHLAHASIRFSLGKYTTEAEIRFVIKTVKAGVEHLRSLSPVWEMYKEGVDVEAML